MGLPTNLNNEEASSDDVASKDALLFVLVAARAQLGEPVGALDARLILSNLDRVHLVRDERLGELDKRWVCVRAPRGFCLGGQCVDTTEPKTCFSIHWPRLKSGGEQGGHLHIRRRILRSPLRTASSSTARPAR